MLTIFYFAKLYFFTVTDGSWLILRGEYLIFIVRRIRVTWIHLCAHVAQYFTLRSAVLGVTILLNKSETNEVVFGLITDEGLAETSKINQNYI